MLIPNTQDCTTHANHVRFVEYTGDYPNLCRGKLTLNIDGEDVTFGYPWTSKPSPMYRPFWSSGGGLRENYAGTHSGEWILIQMNFLKNIVNMHQKSTAYSMKC